MCGTGQSSVFLLIIGYFTSPRVKKQMPIALVGLPVLIALILRWDGLDRKTGSSLLQCFWVPWWSGAGGLASVFRRGDRGGHSPQPRGNLDDAGSAAVGARRAEHFARLAEGEKAVGCPVRTSSSLVSHSFSTRVWNFLA